MKNRIYILALVLLLPLLAAAQPTLVPLGANPYQKSNLGVKLKQAKSADTISLPFLEDFSGGQYGYPDQSKFTDSNAYVNPDFCIGPPTVGCVTLDATNKDGNPYILQTNPIPQGIADYLTSKYIAMASLTPGDSVYFSFLYEPQGFGDPVETGDSLTLWFNSWVDSVETWERVWAVDGGYVDSFRLAMIPITEPRFFHDGFRFRFQNYATLSGWFDHWNVDYIYLNKNRNYADTTFNDVGFVYKAPSLLRNYQQMPFNQYKTDEYFGKIRLTQTNISNIDKTCSYRYKGNYNVGCDETLLSPAAPLEPVYIGGYNNDGFQNFPTLNNCGFPDPLTAETVFTITHVFRSTDSIDLEKRNDTLNFDQIFSDYYAYDDGTAETGLFLQTLGGGAYAQRYKLNYPDTIRAVHMYFVKSVEDVSSREFYLRVWAPDNANPDKPGAVLYERRGIFPQYTDSLNKFVTYTIDSIIPLPVGNFFVGWYQPQDYRINIGFDRNTDHSGQAFYQVLNGPWMPELNIGSAMMRPVVGDATIAPLGINEPLRADALADITLYPNPAGESVNIGHTEAFKGKTVNYTIFNMLGAIQTSGTLNGNTIDISVLQNGLYFVRFDSAGKTTTRKLIVAR